MKAKDFLAETSNEQLRAFARYPVYEDSQEGEELVSKLALVLSEDLKFSSLGYARRIAYDMLVDEVFKRFLSLTE